MAENANKPGPSDSPIFLTILQNMATGEMASIPAERWPKHLAVDWLAELSDNKRRVIEGIMHSRSSGQRQPTGDRQVESLRNLQRMHPPLAIWMDQLQRQLDRAEYDLRRWRELVQQPRTGEDRPLGQQAGPLSEAAQELFDLCSKRGTAVTLHFNGKRPELTRLAQLALAAHSAGLSAPGLVPPEQIMQRLHDLGARFHAFRLRLAQIEMQNTQIRIDHARARRRHIGEQVQRLEQQIRQQSGWGNRLRGRFDKQQVETLKSQLDVWRTQMPSAERPLPREELQVWLSAIIDAYVDSAHASQAEIHAALSAFIRLAHDRRRLVREQLRELQRTVTDAEEARMITDGIDSHRLEEWQSLARDDAEIARRVTELRERLLGDYFATTLQQPIIPD